MSKKTWPRREKREGSANALRRVDLLLPSPRREVMKLDPIATPEAHNTIMKGSCR